MRWTPDSRYVLFPASFEDEEAEKGYREYLFRFSSEDGSVLRLMELTGESAGADALSVSPDGRHVSMLAGENRQEIWRMSFNRGG